MILELPWIFQSSSPLGTHCAGVCRMVRIARRFFIALAALTGLSSLTFVPSVALAADVLRVAYAGSMGAVMDQLIGPAFAKANGVEYQGIGQGSLGLARQ